MTIEHLSSRQILDSRGRPTLETTVTLDTGVSGTAAVPSGASTGSHEALELRDQDPEVYQGAGVLQAVANVTGPIVKALKGLDVRDQRTIDRTMIDLDGTVNKSSVGGNAILSVSLAVMRANAALQRQPLFRAIQQGFDLPEPSAERLPRPMMNIINGGKHADTNVKVQEFMIVPDGSTVSERIERGVNVYHTLGQELKKRKLSSLLGDEGGYAPSLREDTDALDLLQTAVQTAGYTIPTDIGLALDFAASTFFDAATNRYQFGSQAKGLTSVGMTGILEEWLDRYQLLSIEDPLAEDDWEGWAAMTKKLGSRVMVVGDDLFVTNHNRLERGVKAGAANAVLIKPNQIGTLTETIETILKAQDDKYTVIVSHRSGETLDTFIADLAFAFGAPFLKAGAPARGERVAKYNRLLEIEETLRA
ncbi:MAG: phosphopyruvate hydratase [Candidatus Kerfeldbacteria bacterium]|nr:phosphopyruvate hydratase [Candidatus Kerfeldbacteria bacterium]